MPASGEKSLAGSLDAPMTMRRIQPIRGGASTTWQRVGIAGIAGMPVFMGALTLSFVFRPASDSTGWKVVAFAFLYLFVLSGFLLVLAIAMVRVQASRETKRGYTPSANTNVNAAQIDLRTGIVIREPAEPLLTKPQRVEAIRRARAWAAAGER